MKKILIAILLLVPLIIIFTLNVSSSIVSAEIEIGIERLQLTHQGEVVDNVTIFLEEYTETNKQYTLFPDFIPKYATNKDIEWRVSDENMASLRKTGNGIAVSFKKGKYGTVDVIATAKSNTSISAVCTFFVTGKIIGRVDFYDYNTLEQVKSLNLKVDESYCLEARALPFEALGEKVFSWHSSNTNVVTVNQMGVITAKNNGVATVTAEVVDGNNTVSQSITVSVSNKALAKSSTIYTDTNEVDIAEYLNFDSVDIEVPENVEKNGTILTLNEGVQNVDIVLSMDGESQFVKIRKIDRNELVIDYLEVYENYVWSAQHFVPLGTAYFPVSASSPYENVQNIIWTSDNPSVAEVRSGRIIAKKEGVATLQAQAEGFLSATLEVVVSPKIGYVRLELDELGDIAGLNEERVFGLNTVTFNGTSFNVTNSLQMRISYVYPVEIMGSPNIYDYFIFETSDENLASVNKDGCVTFARESIGKKVTITVRARLSENNASDSYTFNVVDGINIGYDVPLTHYDKENPELLPDYTPSRELIYVMEEYTSDYDIDGTLGSVVFHNNVYLPKHDDPDFRWSVHINRPIYGNGYVIDGQLHGTSHDSRIFDSGLQYDRIKKYYGEGYLMVVENLYIQSYAPVSDDSEEAFSDLKARGGIPYRAHLYGESYGIHPVFRYCMFRYAYGHINAAAPIDLEGCIFSNSAGPAIIHQGNYYNGSMVKIKNCIFSNTISPIYLGTTGHAYNKEEDAKTKYLTVKLEGENYIYNWKLLDDVSLNIIPQGGNETLQAIIPAINEKVSDLFRTVMADAENKKLLYSHVKGDYMNFAFVFVGAWRCQNLQVNPDKPEEECGLTESAIIMDENKFSVHTVNMERVQAYVNNNIIFSGACKALNIDFIANPTDIVLPIGKDGVYNTKPGDTYQLDKETKDKLHGIR